MQKMECSVIDTIDEMRNCAVLFTAGGHFSSFELYLEGSNTFLVSCFICNEEYSRNRTIFFTQCVGVHKLSLNDFPVKSIIATMTEDWMSGLNFKLKRHERDVATISFEPSVFKDQPVSFRVRVLPCPTGEPTALPSLDRHIVQNRRSDPKECKLPSSSSSSSSGFFFSCFEDSSLCLNNSDYNSNDGNFISHGDSSSTAGSTPSSGGSISQLYYTKLDEVVHSSEVCYLRTKKPAWNSELQRWIHHFGGRIKMASNNNFLLVNDESSSVVEDLDGLGLGLGLSGGIFKNTEAQVLQHATDYNREDVIVRHGKTTKDTFIVDFKGPISALVALAIVAAVQTPKGLVRAK